MGRRFRNFLIKLLIVAMGIGVGLGFEKKSESLSSKVKAIDEYWAETGLRPEVMSEVFQEGQCLENQRAFLSCINALSVVAEQFHLEFDTFGSLNKEPSKHFLIEREALKPWGDFFETHLLLAKKFPFEEVWQQLISMAPTPRVSFITALAYNAYLSVKHDPHTYLVPLRYYKQVIAASDSQPFSLGFVLARGKNNYYLRKILAQSPSEKAGLLRGDIVHRINGVPINNKTTFELVDLLRPLTNKKIDLKIERNGKHFLVTLQREQDVTIPNVTWKALGLENFQHKRALLSINKFSRETCLETRQAVLEILTSGIQFLVLDLRDNNGGHMNEAACVVGLFAGSGRPAFEVQYLQENHVSMAEKEITLEEQIWPRRIAILVNNGTASAAEIVAGSLRDHGQAFLVGETTFGKGSFQEGEVWEHNPEIAIFRTQGIYTLPSGTSPQIYGLKVDIEIKGQAEPLDRENQYAFPLRLKNFMNHSQEAAPSPKLGVCRDLHTGSQDNTKNDEVYTASRALICHENGWAGVFYEGQ